ncbi:hypothetical protein [Pseudozobellia thermophila]|uniref:Gamma-glutamyl cyclotransferase, AIG2-like n=1 Tax=Pseudozobellia thermophila TaxID=192903 RepID=A0A1M6KUX5_9FLAO|nr:hypothetical protein [Pseudozobellia thermophila]SHJ62670.1 hypothetical protein SAMN04488513_106202 [Pseudozobellia thermophila]
MKDTYLYPWKDFLRSKDEFNLFGYGSLINQFSSQKDIKGSLQLVPVTAIGVKRILNYDPDENVRSRPIYHDPDRGEPYFGAFNVQYTGLDHDRANGVLRRVQKSDYANFTAREIGYSLVRIECFPFDRPEAKSIEAYTLVAPEVYNGRQLVNNDLLPNVPYYKICRDGAKAISAAFLQQWLDTSFLGDGRSVRQWEKDEGLF